MTSSEISRLKELIATWEARSAAVIAYVKHEQPDIALGVASILSDYNQDRARGLVERLEIEWPESEAAYKKGYDDWPIHNSPFNVIKQSREFNLYNDGFKKRAYESIDRQ